MPRKALDRGSVCVGRFPCQVDRGMNILCKFMNLVTIMGIKPYFCRITNKTRDTILLPFAQLIQAIRKVRRTFLNASSVMKAAERALRVTGIYLDVFCCTICEQLGIKYEKLPKREHND